MKIRAPLPEWTLADTLQAFEIASELVESYGVSPYSLSPTCNGRIQDWIKFSSGILRDRETDTFRLKELQYPVSRIVKDSVGRLSTGVVAGHGEAIYAKDAYPARKAAQALLFPFMMSQTSYVAKLVANKMITNRRLYEKTRGVDLTSILTILLRFRDQLSARGVYSEDETRMICSESVPYEFEQVRDAASGLAGEILRTMLRDGVSETRLLARDIGVTDEEVRLEVENAAQARTIPVTLYSEEQNIVTFKGPMLHLWQMDDSIELGLDSNFCAHQNLMDRQTVGSLRHIASQGELPVSTLIENNVTAVRARGLDMAVDVDGWFLPTDDLARVGAIMWSFSVIPQFVKLLPRDQKKELLSGFVKYLLHFHRDEIIGDDGLLFQFVSADASLGFFRLLKEDFHVFCKRPTKTSCLVYDCGIPELVRMLSLSREEFLLLMRVFRPDYTNEKIDRVRDERLSRQIVSDVLFEREGLTCEQLSEELLMDEKVIREITGQMEDDLQIAVTGSRYHFSIDSGDLYSFINDSQIREVMQFE